MVAVLPSTILDSGSAWRSWGAPDAPVRKTEPPARLPAQYREPSEDAPYLSAQIFTPFVAQVLAQFDAAAPTDPQEAAAAYRRTTEVQFAPADILPPI
ncbi:MAG TPA: hypothetical protein VIM38_06045 [Alphaproteobacteria bacterium]|jgi:hypothetical protein